MSPESVAPKRSVLILRVFRKVHRKIAAVLFAFFLVICLTGLLLGWKKHSGGMILPKSHRGVSTDLTNWLPFDSLHGIAVRTLHDSVDPKLSTELERIDARPSHGMVKFVFIEGYWGVQLDATTGELLHIERRTSDFIENIHDGSIIDYLVGTDDEQFKLGYITVMGGSLLTLTITGGWLWYGSKIFRRKKKQLETH